MKISEKFPKCYTSFPTRTIEHDLKFKLKQCDAFLHELQRFIQENKKLNSKQFKFEYDYQYNYSVCFDMYAVDSWGDIDLLMSLKFTTRKIKINFLDPYWIRQLPKTQIKKLQAIAEELGFDFILK